MGFAVICPSRPNYGRTNLTNWKKPEEAADGYAALMEELKIDSYVVIAFSGGGPLATTLALRHPEKIKCLILEVAITGGLKVPGTEEVQTNTFKKVVSSPFFPRGMAYFAAKKPADYVVHFMEKNSTHSAEEAKQQAVEILADPRRAAMVDVVTDMMVGPAVYPECYDSWYNDMDNNQKQIPLEDIKLPTLVIHGTHDALVPLSHG